MFAELQECGLEYKVFFRYLQMSKYYAKKIKLPISRQVNVLTDILTYKKKIIKIIFIRI